MKKARLPKNEQRTKKLTVRLSESEYLKLIEVMDKCAHENPSTFLRISGLRSHVPPRMLTTPLTNEAVQSIKLALKKLDNLEWMRRPEVEELRTELYLLGREVDRFRLEMIAMFREKYDDAISKKRAESADQLARPSHASFGTEFV